MTSIPRIADRLPAALLFCWILLAIPSLSAQEGDEVAEATTPAPRIHDSPRAAMGAFVEGMASYRDLLSYDEADLNLALSTFDPGVDPIDRDSLEMLAAQFFEVVKRVGFDLGDFQGSRLAESWANDGSWVWSTRGSYGTGLAVPFTRIAGGRGSEQADNWRFDAAILESIPAWFEEWKDRPLAGDFLERTDAQADEKLTGLEWARYRLKRVMPDSLRHPALLLENWQWIALAMLAFLGVIFGKIASFVLRRVSKRVGESERLEVDRQTLIDFERPFSFFVTSGTLLWTLPLLGLEPRYYDILRLAAALFTAIAGVWSAYRLVDVGAAMLAVRASRTANRFDDMLVPLLRRTAKIFLTVIGVVYVASFLSEDLYGIVAGLSIGSLAIGFAAKDSIENLFGTVTVLLDKPYQLGDWITVGEIDGTVEEVGFRSTKIRTFYNSVITVPNSRFISAHVDNWGARRYRRIRTMISLTYDTPPLKIESFCEAVRELIRKHPYTRKDYYHVYLNKFAPASLDVLLYCFVQTPDWSTELREKHRLFLDILRVAEGLEIEIAFPTQTIHMAKEKPAGEGAAFAEEAAGAERLGRELADLVVREGMERWDGEKPPPVVID
jgi:MscS family membrane protein